MSKVTANRNALTKTNKSSSHLGYSESYPLILFCNHTSKYGHTHLQTQTLSSTKTCPNSNIPSLSLRREKCTHTRAHTQTHKQYTHPLGGFTECPPRCPTSLLHRAHEIWLSCARLTSILDKANPNLYAAWQAETLSNANARDTLEVVALCGYLKKRKKETVYLPAAAPVCGAVLEPSSWWRCLHLLHQSLPFTFSPSALSSCYSLKRLGIISPQETGNM